MSWTYSKYSFSSIESVIKSLLFSKLLTISSNDGLSFGSSDQHPSINCIYASGISSLNLGRFPLFFISSWKLILLKPLYGSIPVISSYASIANEKMSDSFVYSSSNTSGAMI